MNWVLKSRALSLVTTLGCSAMLVAQSTTRVSVSSLGAEGNKESRHPAISADGRLIAFDSLAKTLVPGDTNLRRDVFLRDLVSAQTVRVSVDSSGAQSVGNSMEPSLSADGHVVAFASYADNLVAGDTNVRKDIFVRDLVSGVTSRVSVSSAGTEADDECSFPSLSGDGRFVVFESDATNLVPEVLFGYRDIFCHDRVSGQTTRISNGLNGSDALGSSTYAVISADGRFIAFESGANNLVLNDTNGYGDIFVCERITGQLTRISVGPGGVQGDTSCYGPAISADGRFVAFDSGSSNIVFNDNNHARDVFVHDRLIGITEIASAVHGGVAQANDGSGGASLSADGRFVVFGSNATNLVANDGNGLADIFLRDRLTHVTTCISLVSPGIHGDEDSGLPRISADGRTVAFDSLAGNLVAADNNLDWDVFARVPAGCEPIVYCTAGTSTAGCAATIEGFGTPSASASSGFTISVSNVEGLKTGLIFYGVNGRQSLSWGAGSTSFLCVALPTQRMGVQSSGGNFAQCDGVLSIDWNAFIAAHPSALGAPFTAGQIVDAQAWYRDPPNPKSSSLSNALDVIVCP